ncbi:MAG: hemolysin III family protein [Victivallales bacterium]|nr:hemolysin III family protein [Victivallales bacterium]
MTGTREIGEYTCGEEIANSITHGIGTLLSIAALTLLVVFAARYGNAWYIVTYAVFGATLVLLFLASTLYHSVTRPDWKRLLKICDHAAIYLLIAGTYTPLMLISVGGGLGWTVFGLIWGMATAGIVMKCFYTGRFRLFSTLLYLGMGWFCLFTLKSLLAHLPTASVIFLFAGGLSYSFGAIFYVWKKLPYGHAVWHLFVLGGSTLHFFAVLTMLP